MESLAWLREALGWCTVLNVSLLLVAGMGVAFLGDFIRRIHARFYRLSDDDLSRAYFQYLAQYKIAIFVFNLVPYLALRIME